METQLPKGSLRNQTWFFYGTVSQQNSLFRNFIFKEYTLYVISAQYIIWHELKLKYPFAHFLLYSKFKFTFANILS